MRGRGVLVAGVEVKAPSALRLRLVSGWWWRKPDIMNGRERLVARFLYRLSHRHSLSGMRACAVMFMQSFIHLDASGQIAVHSSA